MLILAKRLLLTLLTVSLSLVIISYLFVQTTPASLIISHWLSKKYAFTLNVGHIKYSFADPLTLQLNQVNYIDNDEHVILTAPVVNITFDYTKLASCHIKRIVLQEGSLQWDSNKKNNSTFIIDQLVLKNMTLLVREHQHFIQGKNINAGVYPLKMGQSLFQYDQAFNLSASHITIDGIDAENILVEGKSIQGKLAITNIGATLAHGQVSGNFERTKKGDWIINQLLLNNMGWQFNQSLEDLYKAIKNWPRIYIKQATATAITFEGKNWSVNDMDFTVDNLHLQPDIGDLNDGWITLNALQFKWHDLNFNEVITKLALTDQQIQIKHLSGRWDKGIVRAEGFWLPNEREFNFDELAINGIEYIMPVTYHTFLQTPLPDWLDTLKIAHLKLNKSIIIDTTSSFPSQLTMLAIEGQDLTLIKQHKAGIWQGKLQLSADNATFNKIDLFYPQLSLQANNDEIIIDDITALTKEGLLEGRLIIKQATPSLFYIDMHGQQITANTLVSWGWLSQNESEKDTTLNFEINLPYQPLSQLPHYIKILNKNKEL